MKWQLLSHAIRNCGGSGLAAESGIMKVLIATDAWRPQVNGVVRTLGALARAAAKIGGEIRIFISGWFLDLSPLLIRDGAGAARGKSDRHVDRAGET